MFGVILPYLGFACAILTDADLAARLDLDGDGVPRPQDCDDADSTIGPEYLDGDGDGYAGAEQAARCEVADGVLAAEDCDDTNPDISPAASERCDKENVDEDCDGLRDDDDSGAEGRETTYRDLDGDGLAGVGNPAETCDASGASAEGPFDCDDTDPNATVDGCTWVAVAAGQYDTCAIRSDATAICWGRAGTVAFPTPMGSLGVTTSEAPAECGLTLSGSIACAQSTYYEPAPTGRHTTISGGMYHLCAVDITGGLGCWMMEAWTGVPDYGQGDAVAGTYATVAGGVFASCALDSTGAPECWGDCTGDTESFGLCEYTSPRYNQLDLGLRAGCGILPDGSAECWGYLATQVDGAYVDFPQPPSGVYTQISLAYDFACGLHDTGAISCWGADTVGETAAPTGTYTLVSVGLRFACAVTTEGAITCWGQNDDGQADVPDP